MAEEDIVQTGEEIEKASKFDSSFVRDVDLELAELCRGGERCDDVWEPLIVPSEHVVDTDV